MIRESNFSQVSGVSPLIFTAGHRHYIDKCQYFVLSLKVQSKSSVIPHPADV
jgi:hypothetical protein